MLDAPAFRMVAKHYRELVCWQLSNELKLKVYAFTARTPASNDFKYCNQVRDSARSATRNIAEGFGRFQPLDFARFLQIARASLAETHNHLGDALDLSYLTSSECEEMIRLADRAAGATTRLLQYLHRFAKNARRRGYKPPN
jgi:four helix bundle protein